MTEDQLQREFAKWWDSDPKRRPIASDDPPYLEAYEVFKYARSLPPVATEADLNDKLKAAGMLTIEQIVAGTPMDKWMAHTGVTDMESFEKWLLSVRTEFLTMQGSLDLAKRTEDDLYEWVLAHVAALGAVHINFKKAIASIQPTVTNLKSGDEYRYVGEGIDATNSTEGRPMVIYSRDGEIHFRESTEFVEKFSVPDHVEINLNTRKKPLPH